MAILGKARARFRWHKRSANHRGISFEFTFTEWYNWWLSQGIDKDQDTVFTNKDTLAMCRFNDTGPYNIDNVYCATISQNSKDALPSYPSNKKRIKTPLGIFSSRLQAAQAHAIDPGTINHRMKKHPREYYYL